MGHRVNSRNEQTEYIAHTRKNEAHAQFLERACKACALVVLLVYDRYEEHKQGEEDACDRYEKCEACETSCDATRINEPQSTRTRARDVQGPTFHFAWNAATLAKQHIARKLKNTCDAWNIMAGFDTIICKARCQLRKDKDRTRKI